MKVLALVVALASCQTATVDPSKIYRRNMHMSINEVIYNGTAVVPAGIGFNIRATFKSSIEKLKMNTCHRYYVQNKVGKKWSYTYKKNKGIEDVGVCIMDIGAFDDKGFNSWGMVEFRNDVDVNLPTELSCNGELTHPVGVSICQSQAGLRQSIGFKSDTIVYGQDECDKPFTYDGKTFFYDINRGSCVYIFQQGGKFHRHRTFGYDDEL